VCTTTNLESTVLLEEQTAKKKTGAARGVFAKRRQSRALPPSRLLSSARCSFVFLLVWPFPANFVVHPPKNRAEAREQKRARFWPRRAPPRAPGNAAKQSYPWPCVYFDPQHLHYILHCSYLAYCYTDSYCYLQDFILFLQPTGSPKEEMQWWLGINKGSKLGRSSIQSLDARAQEGAVSPTVKPLSPFLFCNEVKVFFLHLAITLSLAIAKGEMAGS
jgi:hypothetical protein